MTKPILIGEDCSLAEPELHDAHLYRIDFGGKRVSCHFRVASGKQVILEFRGVLQMLSNGLAEDNIVLDVAIYEDREAIASVLGNLFASHTQAQREYCTKITERLLARELMLMHLSPSYGGEIYVICEEAGYEESGPA